MLWFFFCFIRSMLSHTFMCSCLICHMEPLNIRTRYIFDLMAVTNGIKISQDARSVHNLPRLGDKCVAMAEILIIWAAATKLPPISSRRQILWVFIKRVRQERRRFYVNGNVSKFALCQSVPRWIKYAFDLQSCLIKFAILCLMAWFLAAISRQSMLLAPTNSRSQQQQREHNVPHFSLTCAFSAAKCSRFACKSNFLSEMSSCSSVDLWYNWFSRMRSWARNSDSNDSYK